MSSATEKLHGRVILIAPGCFVEAMTVQNNRRHSYFRYDMLKNDKIENSHETNAPEILLDGGTGINTFYTKVNFLERGYIKELFPNTVD